jgi:hypothetical protein
MYYHEVFGRTGTDLVNLEQQSEYELKDLPDPRSDAVFT